VIRWPLFLVAAAWLHAAHGAARGSLPFPAPDLHACLTVYLALYAGEATLPWLLALSAVARAPLAGSDPCTQLLVVLPLGLFVMPQRRWFYRGRVLYLAVLAALVSSGGRELERALAVLREDGPIEALGAVPAECLATALAAPLVVALLYRLPPFSSFAERGAL
jgi:hypothetical protein